MAASEVNPQDNSELLELVVSLFEVKLLERVERTGTSIFLDPMYKQSIASHSYYVALLALVV